MHWHLSVVLQYWLRASLMEISAEVMEVVAHYRLFAIMCYTNPHLLHFTLLCQLYANYLMALRYDRGSGV